MLEMTENIPLRLCQIYGVKSYEERNVQRHGGESPPWLSQQSLLSMLHGQRTSFQC